VESEPLGGFASVVSELELSTGFSASEISFVIGGVCKVKKGTF